MRLLLVAAAIAVLGGSLAHAQAQAGRRSRVAPKSRDARADRVTRGRKRPPERARRRPRQGRLDYLRRRDLPVHRVSKAIERGDFAAARAEVERVFKTNGLAKRDKSKGVEFVEDRVLYSWGTHYEGHIKLAESTRKKAQEFAELFNESPRRTVESLRRQHRPGAALEVRRPMRMRTFIHETLHNYGPGYEYKGVSLIVEEATTELLARQVMRHWWKQKSHYDREGGGQGSVVFGTYEKYTDPLRDAVARIYGVNERRATRMLEQAAKRFKSLSEETAGQREFVELFARQLEPGRRSARRESAGAARPPLSKRQRRLVEAIFDLREKGDG